MFEFKITAECPVTGARAGEFVTLHGIFRTPVFMPVGTQATVKAMTPPELEELGAGIILANTYHLYLRPGIEVMRLAGGLHAFMGWRHPILTDSGGFQVFSLSGLRKVTDDGVEFRSHLDGSKHFMTPELSMEVQSVLGSDIAMSFDECVKLPAAEDVSRAAMERTLKWAARGAEFFERRGIQNQALFGIVQGALYEEQRAECAERLAEIGFPGYAIGGLSVGESHGEMYRILDVTDKTLPRDKPRYLMGVGMPENLVEGVARGVDMFDCVLPSRNGRMGSLLTRHGRINIKNARFERDFTPIDDECDCYACRNFTKAYVRHLYRAGEILASRLCTWHNLRFLTRLMEDARAAIISGTFPEFRAKTMSRLALASQENTDGPTDS
ncbi:MAG: tRNA guanosine(34) transglycosylase Tgt [Synergistaceae bacterium]|jgi:queuine tRNA-ribosyltransferase|nr:tRNA guanosine(34) transglycosylase Tgt [Synergistaceae bacterium]